MAKIKITISTEKTASVDTQKTISAGINKSKDNNDDVVDKISSLLNIERSNCDNERWSIEDC